MRAPRRSPRFCCSLNCAMSSGSFAILVVVVTPHKAYCRKLGIAILTDVAVRIDDAGDQELASCVDHPCAGGLAK